MKKNTEILMRSEYVVQPVEFVPINGFLFTDAKQGVEFRSAGCRLGSFRYRDDGFGHDMIILFFHSIFVLCVFFLNSVVFAAATDASALRKRQSIRLQPFFAFPDGSVASGLLHEAFHGAR